ncbi:MAG: GAF domain-containing protein [Microscillaceae bacterium]|nr:GAF domain-containing protein [Microscillaceae bacterium]
MIRTLFLKLSIRYKLMVAFSSILFLSVVLIIIAINSNNQILKYRDLNEEIDDLQVLILSLNIAEKNFSENGFKNETFLKEGHSEDVLQFQGYYQEILRELNHVKSNPSLSDDLTINKLSSISQKLTVYQNDFNKLVEVFKERGFKDYGVEGQLRKAIHDVEDTPFDYDKATMLMLRRHEKDFFLRKDLKYLQQFNETIDKFIQTISQKATSSPAAAKTKQKIIKDLEEYKNKFNYIVELEKQIGLDERSGIKGKLFASRTLIIPQIEELNTLIKSYSSKLINNRLILLLGLFFFQLIIGVILIIFYSNLITRAIREIERSIVSLSNGIFPKKLAIRTQDELGHTKIALNNLVKRIKTATRFANNLGNGQLSEKYDEKFRNDVLAKSIIALQDKLFQAEEERQKINWVNQGIAHLNQIIQDEQENLRDFSLKILENLILYLNAQQGAIFLVRKEDNQEFLERIATYAYGRRKYLRQVIEAGDNLLSQAALSKKSIYMTDLPEGYARISTGLGEASPRNIFISPLKVREEVMGIIELASFHIFESYHREFIEKISENIANILFNKQINEHTKQYLEESRKQTEMLLAQEEELRQSSAELKSAQEELESQKKSMEDEIRSLRKLLNEQKTGNQEIYR